MRHTLKRGKGIDCSARFANDADIACARAAAARGAA
jgi:hypothetical protein